MPGCCIKPANYKPGPDPYKRPGFERVFCKVCGKWLGDHDRKLDEDAGQRRQARLKGNR